MLATGAKAKVTAGRLSKKQVPALSGDLNIKTSQLP
jgi:hypothetical protein